MGRATNWILSSLVLTRIRMSCLPLSCARLTALCGGSASKHMNDNWVQIFEEQRQRNTELPASNMGLIERHSRHINPATQKDIVLKSSRGRQPSDDMK